MSLITDENCLYSLTARLMDTLFEMKHLVIDRPQGLSRARSIMRIIMNLIYIWKIVQRKYEAVRRRPWIKKVLNARKIARKIKSTWSYISLLWCCWKCVLTICA